MAIRWRHAVISGITVSAAFALTAGAGAPGTVAAAMADQAGSSRTPAAAPAAEVARVAGGGFTDEEWGDDDTGVTPVAALSGAGKVLNGPDLSFESQAAGTRYLDGYGHGTHMAAIIAGRDPSTPGFWIGRPMPGQQMATWLESTVAGRKNGLGAPLPGVPSGAA